MIESKNIKIPERLRYFRKDKLSIAIYSLLSHPDKLDMLNSKLNEEKYSTTRQIRVQINDETNKWVSIFKELYGYSLTQIVSLALLNKEGDNYYFYNTK